MALLPHSQAFAHWGVFLHVVKALAVIYNMQNKWPVFFCAKTKTTGKWKLGKKELQRSYASGIVQLVMYMYVSLRKLIFIAR